MEKIYHTKTNERRSNQSILKEINSEYLLEGLILKPNTLIICCEEPLIRKDPDAGKD